MFPESYLQANRLSHVHPINKVMFFLLFIVFAFLSKSVGFLCLQGLSIVAFILFSVKMPKSVLLKMLLLPFGFVLLGILPLVITREPDLIMKLWKGWGVSSNGLQQSELILSRSFALTTAMYWFILVTSVQELVYIFRKIKLPALFIDVLLLVYRNIFLLLGVSNQIHRTQTCRMGYNNARNGYRSLVSLMGQTFVLSYYRADRQYNSVLTRGYQGEWPASVLPVKFSKNYLGLWFGFLIFLAEGFILI
ncbi:cobalt ECF transporter T component CbiQ [Parabacteroides sp. FAFU027]|uniref:cobalt ECF transporter T component CbiQ n=1 Tax=Parabacteroides sp. FAFU027 TaxID=2922715 RepID=UPI0021D429C4|nr:cobalt ECF transporter T component CbiQ [Parabacteroides sp. FAFU027]